MKCNHSSQPTKQQLERGVNVNFTPDALGVELQHVSAVGDLQLWLVGCVVG
jgi:hypothetical protein